jgi:hypothetical protein
MGAEHAAESSGPSAEGNGSPGELWESFGFARGGLGQTHGRRVPAGHDAAEGPYSLTPATWHGENTARTVLGRSTRTGASCYGQRLYFVSGRPVARLAEELRHVPQAFGPTRLMGTPTGRLVWEQDPRAGISGNHINGSPACHVR